MKYLLNLLIGLGCFGLAIALMFFALWMIELFDEEPEPENQIPIPIQIDEEKEETIVVS